MKYIEFDVEKLVGKTLMLSSNFIILTSIWPPDAKPWLIMQENESDIMPFNGEGELPNEDFDKTSL